MPITEDGKVNFTTTLFALIRENLSIKMRPAEEMDQADRELKHTLNKLWPLQAKKIIDKLIPPHEGIGRLLKITRKKLIKSHKFDRKWSLSTVKQFCPTLEY
jgi:hypothetical protein